MLDFLRTRQWIVARRLILVGIVLYVGYRSYGDNITAFLTRSNPQSDIEITKTEFRVDIPAERPIWIIGLRNASRRYTYDRIELEASYFDKDGTFLQKDKLVISQRLDPLQEKTLASPDFKKRENAARGSLAVLTARRVN
jgi:hypothetical protein